MYDIQVRVLLADADAGSRTTLAERLRENPYYAFEARPVDSLATLLARLASEHFDVLLLDLELSDSDGLTTLRAALDRCGEIPIVVLTRAEQDDELSLQALDEGAMDCLPKPEASSEALTRSIRYAMQRRYTLSLQERNRLLEEKNHRLAELYETAQRFVDNVSHEFRTPLTVIREFAAIVRDGLDGPINAMQSKHLEAVLDRTDDLALMVDDLLDVSRMEAGLLRVWRRRHELSELLRTAQQLCQRRADAKRIQLVTPVRPAPTVFCDEEKVRRILVNLVVNAIKFSPEGATVRIDWCADGESEVRVSVSDEGPGVSESERELIFERFRQADAAERGAKGFGLGLNIARELTHVNLGQMSLESELGVGSTFSFSLPRADVASVLRCHQRSLRESHPEATSVHLFQLEAIGDDPSIAGAVNDFLCRHFRGRDLVFEGPQQQWAVVAVCPDAELADLQARLMGRWRKYVEEFAETRPGRELPELSLQSHTRHLIENAPKSILTQLPGLWRGCAGDRRDPESDAAAPDTSSTVLIVDDEPDLVDGLRVRLETLGYRVVTACDGVAGLQAARTHAPDAILMDVRMPRLDGLAALGELKSEPSTQHIPVIVLSASLADRRHAIERGARYFVPKPFASNAVLGALASVLNDATSLPV